VHVHPHQRAGPAALGQNTSKRGRRRLRRQGERLPLCFAPCIATRIRLSHAIVVFWQPPKPAPHDYYAYLADKRRREEALRDALQVRRLSLSVTSWRTSAPGPPLTPSLLVLSRIARPRQRRS